MNISILASIGCQNLGDELILKNEVELLREKYGSQSKFRVFTYDTRTPFFVDEQVSYLEYFPVGSRNPKNIWRNIRNWSNFITTLFWSDLVVIGGGGLFYENEVQSTRSPLDLWKYRMNWITGLRRHVLFFAVGIDVVSDAGKQKIQEIFGYKKAEITVRDNESFFLLQELGIQSTIIDDPVFSEDSGAERGKILGAFHSRNFSLGNITNYTFRDKTVGVALRKGYIGKSKSDKLEVLMIEELLSTIEKKGGTIVLLPHSFHQVDEKANDYEFLEKFQKNNRTIKTSMQEVYEVYTLKQIDICVGMRLHSIILSYVYGVDILALSYSKKTDEALKNLSR